MRFRLLRRRLTISAPRMAIRSDLPWPFRWVAMAVVLGFCAAIGLWAFELGKNLAGIDNGAKDELVKLRAEVAKLTSERDKAQSVANTSNTVMAADRAAQDQLAVRARQLEAENRSLRDDLGFYERLLPTGNAEGVQIRALQVEPLGNNAYKWQVLLIQPSKNAPEFNGKLEVTLMGNLAGKSWSMGLPSGSMGVSVRQSRRYEGVIDVPPGVTAKGASARVLEGSSTKSSQTIKL
jgi:hypothetical protein